MPISSDYAGEIEFLQEKLRRNCESFRTKKDSNRSKAFVLKMAVAGAGTLATIALGIKGYVDDDMAVDRLSMLALMLSAIVPVLAAWETFFDYRWLWIRYTATLNALYAISDDLDYEIHRDTVDQKKLDVFYARLQAVLQDTDGAWSARRVQALKQEDDKAQSDAAKSPPAS